MHGSVARLQTAVTKSKRSGSVRLPRAFALDDVYNPPNPPLARLLRGGGGVRLKVLLTVLMMATSAPHETRVTSALLAELLGLPDPEEAGSRRVTAAFRFLTRLNLVSRERMPGYTPITKVLNPDGSGEEWNDRFLPQPYISLPIDLWRRGWIIALSGRALALLVILKEATNGRKGAPEALPGEPKVHSAWLDGTRKAQYGLGKDFWASATKELVDAGLLDVETEIVLSYGEPRRRNVYKLHVARLSSYDPGKAPPCIYNGI